MIIVFIHFFVIILSNIKLIFGNDVSFAKIIKLLFKLLFKFLFGCLFKYIFKILLKFLFYLMTNVLYLFKCIVKKCLSKMCYYFLIKIYQRNSNKDYSLIIWNMLHIYQRNFEKTQIIKKSFEKLDKFETTKNILQQFPKSNQNQKQH